MITLRDRWTGDLFDRWSEPGERRRRLLNRPWAEVFRSHLLDNLPIDGLLPHVDERMGRPSKDLHIVISVLLLQQLHDLSDAATVEASAFNMAWHHALDVRSEADCYCCEKTVRNDRRLFIAQGPDEVLFRRMTDRLVRAFDVETSRQRMDPTALRSAMRSLMRLGIVVETISKFARELERVHPELHALIDADLIRRYVDREGAALPPSASPDMRPCAQRWITTRRGCAACRLVSPRRSSRAIFCAPNYGWTDARSAFAALYRSATVSC